jgi:hypothetical protein
MRSGLSALNKSEPVKAKEKDLNLLSGVSDIYVHSCVKNSVQQQVRK